MWLLGSNIFCHGRNKHCHGRNGVSTAGFLPQLESLLGTGSFDHGAESDRFLALIASGNRVGSALAHHWAALQDPAGGGG